ncbi:uncharacterized protein FTOL_11328 [Fusarium torulosum]|uniref:Uncharacterized protein n=1 Tax=Fusarium torulosum TaxID=33205 RepID=A0AAE8MJT8_9HYPO|nr:uncharacterized protein FTOL_11328 [Fusarium torulosum]
MEDFNDANLNGAYMPGSLLHDVTSSLQPEFVTDPLNDPAFLDSLNGPDSEDPNYWGLVHQTNPDFIDPSLNDGATPTSVFSQTQAYETFPATSNDVSLPYTSVLDQNLTYAVSPDHQNVVYTTAAVHQNAVSYASPVGQNVVSKASNNGLAHSPTPVSSRYRPAKTVRVPSLVPQQQEVPVQQYQFENLNSYQPSIEYSPQGINGNNGIVNLPLLPPNPVRAGINEFAQQFPHLPPLNTGLQGVFVPPTPQIQQPISECISCGCQPHRGPCPPLQLQMHQFQQFQQLQAQCAIKAEVSIPSPTRKRPSKNDDNYANDHAVKFRKTAQNGRRLPAPRRGRAGKADAKKHYPASVQINEWQANGVHFSYQQGGQWDEDILLSAMDLRAYVDNCPRKLTIWLQNTPSQVGQRTSKCDMRCRYSECPVKYGTMRNGWFRVAFDEFPEHTTNGLLDPYRVAGSMHLWCFEQCIDPFELFQKGMLVGDERVFQLEHNAMTLLRSGEKDIFEAAIDPWIESRQQMGVSFQIPYARHEDTLSYALIKHHLERQPGTRQHVRDKRNGERQRDKLKTQDIHMGRLDFFVERDEASKAKLKGKMEYQRPAKRQYRLSAVPEQKESTADDDLSKDFASMIDAYIPQATMQDFEDVQVQSKVEETLATMAPLPAHSSTVEDTIMADAPADQTVDHANVTLGTPTDLFSPKVLEAKEVTVSEQLGDKSESGGLAFLKAQRSPSCSPHTKYMEIQKGERPLPDISHHMKGRKSWAQVKAATALFEEQSPRSASGNAGEEAQRSPLRRSSRVSVKRTP